jgi:hypothetical protein
MVTAEQKQLLQIANLQPTQAKSPTALCKKNMIKFWRNSQH